MNRDSLGLLQWRLSQVPILGRNAADDVLQRQPQVQAHPAAQHALTHVPCARFDLACCCNIAKCSFIWEPVKLHPLCTSGLKGAREG